MTSTNEDMQGLIAMVNKIQDAYAQLGSRVPIDLPQIAVVGGQSAGKSSVLENFVGKDFLPRGSGIVTRRPLILQLNNHPTEEYGEFLHCKGRRFDSFDEIRKEIEAETDRMTGENKGISNIPINLSVHSPAVLDLTVIDLPGLTKVPVGDQPHDIEAQIRDMIMEFITRPNCVILAVSPANQDLANSDALKLAKEVDPQGIRTIGVLTKLDLMDAGTDAREILENKTLPLRRGYVGIVNRSQADINGNKDIRAAQSAERKFFLSREEYRHLADKMGTKYLQKVLNQQLVNHIREVLPVLRATLQKQVNGMEKEVQKMKKEHLSDAGRTNTKNMVKMISTVGVELEKKISGGGGGSDSMDVTTLSGGARIAKVFHERFPFEMAKVQLDEKQLEREIGFAIKNANGIRVGLFSPDEAFGSISKRMIQKLLPACQKCCDMVIQEVATIIDAVWQKVDRFPRFQDEIKSSMTNYLTELEEKTKDQIELMINFELAYINANHPDFIGFHNAAKMGVKKKKAGGASAANSAADGKIKQGWLQVMGKQTFGSKLKDYWYVLKEESLAWYKDESEKDMKHMISCEGLKVKDTKGSTKTAKNSFIIFDPEGKQLYKDSLELELTANSQDEKETWQAALLRADILPVSGDDDSKVERGLDQMTVDPMLTQQIMTIRNLVDSYMDIVRKKLRDSLPKICMHLVVDRVVEFGKEDLLGSLYSSVGDVESLLEESETARQQREDMIAMYDASKIALKIITDVTMHTKTEALPPPVTNSIVVDRTPAARRTPSVSSNPSSPVRSTTTSNRPPPPSSNTRPPPPSARPKPKAPAKVPQRPAVPGRPSVPTRPTR